MSVPGTYVVRARAGGYVRIVAMRPHLVAGRGEATVFGFDDACDFLSYHCEDPRAHALVRLDGPFAALRDALGALRTALPSPRAVLRSLRRG